MIIIRLTGGLGNQMFQYAFGKALALKYGVELKLDISLLGENKSIENLVVRHFDLDAFNLKEDFATRQEIESYNGKNNPGVIDRIIYRLNKMLGKFPLIIQNNHDYDIKQISGIRKNACIVGRWQSELYFKEFESDIRKVFSFSRFIPNNYSVNMAKEMMPSLSVAVHVRRKDYINHPVYSKGVGGLDKRYYFNAVSLLQKKISDKGEIKFFFISDDMEWCKRNFGLVDGAVFVEQEKNKLGYLSDLWLLAQCRHSIISNSTFSWWGAWLGEKKDSIIIAPSNWAKDTRYIPKNIIPDRWVKLKSTFENL